MSVTAFLEKVRKTYATGQATEHSYRSALEALLESAAPGLDAINEPKRVACGAPDFIVERKGIPVGHCEAKDLHIDLRSLKDANLNQKKRYLKALPNLIYTNGLDFEFYKAGALLRRISIGTLVGGKIEAIPAEFETLSNQLSAFAAETPQSINSAKKLAEMMAGKAVLIKDIMSNALREDAMLQTELTGQYQAFKAHLIHDIDADEFADIYAETIAYGLFAARLHDTNLDTFSRAEALELLPKSNPFLRSLFGYIAGVDLDDRIKWVIDELCDVFRACDIGALMADFGKFTARNDPFLHFYETFLAEYNPAKRKARGVWYTPEPVVNFIVRAVDDVLKTEFGLPLGLADTSKITIPWDTGQTDNKGARQTIQKQVHRVQILDPATGTGTFLAEAIKQIAAQVKPHAEGMWSTYVEQDLIPRLHGFELLMASYAMCHMKLDMMLTEMGYKPTATPPRLGVYLTNSLEEGEAVTQNLFAQWLANEAKSASEIKRQMPIMCVIGNPPYSGESANKGDWIMGLMEAYKKEPGGIGKLQEKNPKWINKDEHKFIRFAEHMIEKNGEGILGFISSHGYLSDPTLRGMRWHLLNTFDKIYVLDLHGNANKKEVSPNGSADKNVFDIMQGVAIIIGVKKVIKAGEEKPLAKVYHTELWGARDAKYTALWEGQIPLLDWSTVNPTTPKFVMIPTDQSLSETYESYPSLAEIFSPNGAPAPGLVTTHDQFAISWNRTETIAKVESLLSSETEADARKLFKLCSQNQWNYNKAKLTLAAIDWKSEIRPVVYRPFDTRLTVYNPHIAVHRRERMTKHFVLGDNFGIVTSRMTKGEDFAHALAVGTFTEAILLSPKTSNNGFNFPLYLYPEPGSLETGRRVNFDPKIYAAILAAAGIKSAPERGGGPPPWVVEGPVEAALTLSKLNPVAPDPSVSPSGLPPPRSGEDFPTDLPPELRVFDYIYGVLHSPDYRRIYAQFLKIDFPRIPYPASPEVFAHIAEKGGQLRRLHLMEDAAIGDTPYPFKGEGAGEVVKPSFSIPPRNGEGDRPLVVEGSVEAALTLSESNPVAPDPSVSPSGLPPPRSGAELGRVHINPAQWFENIPQTAWEFHIGGYQPAQKWLKDRKGRTLSFEDVRHYQKIIKILCETDRIMREIILPL